MSLFSIDLAVRDHARLAESLAEHIRRLRHARSGHRDLDAMRTRLDAFLTDEFMPYLHSEEVTLYARSAEARHVAGPVARAQRRPRGDCATIAGSSPPRPDYDQPKQLPWPLPGPNASAHRGPGADTRKGKNVLRRAYRIGGDQRLPLHTATRG